MVPGPQYEAGWLHRLLLGRGYRDLWTTPIEVPLLDLRRHGGGLEPTGTGGGEQTEQLRFTGADGRPYTFRSLDKDPAGAVPPGMRSSLVLEVVRDQTSMALPTTAEVASELMDALAILHARPRLIVLPDDPLLGEFRREFAGKLGTIGEYPVAGEDGKPDFAGARRIVDTPELLFILREDPRERLDQRALLTARLLDQLIGDWDRHPGQWRWAQAGAGEPPAWLPVPEDRDQAFSSYDGLLVSIAGGGASKLADFDDEYPGLLRFNWNGREIDRNLLVGLDRAAWDSVAASMQARLTDEVIARAVARLPAAHRALRGEWLARMLRARRAALPEAAGDFYRLLAGEVDVVLTAASERVEVRRHPDGDLELTARAPGVAAPVYRRRFGTAETREVRLYLGAGDDTVTIGGAAATPIRLRVISPVGNDLVADGAGRRSILVYDDGAPGGVVAHGARLVRRLELPDEPGIPRLRETPHLLPPRDWGRSAGLTLWPDFTSDLGLMLKLRRSQRFLGFRRQPFDHEFCFEATWAADPGAFRALAGLQVMDESSADGWTADVLGSGLEVLRFYGFGNDTPERGPSAAVDHQFYRLRLARDHVPAPGWRLEAAALFQHAISEAPDGSRLARDAPAGLGRRSRAGLGLAVARENPLGLADRWTGRLEGAWHPAALGDRGGDWARFDAWLERRLRPLGRLSLEGRLSGAGLLGSYPWDQAAFLGGRESLRGFEHDRFAGDASLLGSLRTRFHLMEETLLVPNRIELLLRADAGRVWLEGESSGDWHVGYGAGLWVTLLATGTGAGLSVGWSEESTEYYLEAGAGF